MDLLGNATRSAGLSPSCHHLLLVVTTKKVSVLECACPLKVLQTNVFPLCSQPIASTHPVSTSIVSQICLHVLNQNPNAATILCGVYSQLRAAPELPPENGPLSPGEDVLENELELSCTSHPPPPFIPHPLELFLETQPYIIESTIASARPLYLLSRPLNGHAQATRLINAPPERRLRELRTLKSVRDRYQLYRFYHEHGGIRRYAASLEAIVSGQHRDHSSGVKLRKSLRGLQGCK